jgi:hypothetical protein
MNDKALYAKNIGDIGEGMKKVSVAFGGASPTKINSEKELASLILNYEVSLRELQKLEDNFKKVQAPQGFEKDHEKMLLAFSEYVRATEDMVSSVSGDPKSFISESYSIAEKRQQVATQKIVITTKELGEKMFSKNK